MAEFWENDPTVETAQTPVADDSADWWKKDSVVGGAVEEGRPIPEIKAAPAPTLMEQIRSFMAPTQPASALQVHGKSGVSLLGTTEQIPADPTDSGLMAAGKAIVNVGNATMAGMTSPELIGLLPIAGAGGATARILGAGFAADMATHIPEQVGQAVNAPTTQGKIEGGLGAAISTLFAAAGATHATGLTAKLFPKATESPLDPTLPKSAVPEQALPKSELQDTTATPEVVSGVEPKIETVPKDQLTPGSEQYIVEHGYDTPAILEAVKSGQKPLAVLGDIPAKDLPSVYEAINRGEIATFDDYIGKDQKTVESNFFKMSNLRGKFFDKEITYGDFWRQQGELFGYTKSEINQWIAKMDAKIPDNPISKQFMSDGKKSDTTPVDIWNQIEAANKPKTVPESLSASILKAEPVDLNQQSLTKINEPPEGEQMRKSAERATTPEVVSGVEPKIETGPLQEGRQYPSGIGGDAIAESVPATRSKNQEQSQVQPNLSQELLNDYVEASWEKDTVGTLDFLLENNVPDSQILKSVQQQSPNFGAPELERYKRNKAQPVSTSATETTASVLEAKPNELKAESITSETPVGVTEGEIMSPGPGAASVKEVLASYEERRFGKRLQEDENISPEIRAETGNRFYEPISNKITVKEAESIIEQRGTDEGVRIVKDIAEPLDFRVRSVLGQGLIKKLNLSETEARTAGDTVRAQGFRDQAIDVAEFVSEFGTQLGQGVQAFAVWNRLTPEMMLVAARKTAKKSGAELTPEVEAKIELLAEEVKKAPEGFQRDEKTMDLLNYMSDIKGVNPSDVPTALYYANILSGYSTQLVNTIDTGLNVLSEAGAMATSHPTAVPQILTGLYRGMIRGGFEAADILKTGKSKTGDKISQQRILERTTFGEKGGVPIAPETALGRFMKRAFESKVATPLNLWKYPLRAMLASDTVMYNSMKEARARVLARVMAKKEGLSGDQLFSRVEQILNEKEGRQEISEQQAKSEGLEGIKFNRRVAELTEQGRPEELVSAADEAAAIATYNHTPSGLLGLIAQKIAETTQAAPALKAIVPFTRIVANVTNRGLDYTPWGYKRLFFGNWGGKQFRADPPVGEAFKTQMVKATLGTTAMASLAALDAADQIQVSASGPADANERKQLQNSGWKPYSVKVGDTYLSYQYTPLNLGLAMVGHYRDAIRYNKLSEEDAGARLAYGMLKSSSTVFDMSFLSGVSDFMETVQGTTSSTKGASRLLTRTATSLAVPNLVKQVDKLFDPTIYQGDTITQALVRETPVARSFLLKPMLNVLGEPIKPSQNRFFTFETEDPVWKLIVAKQAWVPVPSKTTKIGNRPIKPDEYYKLIEQSGPQIRDYIKNRLPQLEQMPAEQAQDEIRDQSTKIRKQIKSRF